MAYVVFNRCWWGLCRCHLPHCEDSEKVKGQWRRGCNIKHDLVNCWRSADDAPVWRYAGSNRLHGDAVIAEIELIHLLDDDEAEFPEAAMLAASLVRRGWAHRMPAKYQALAHDFIEQGIIRDEITEVTPDMKPRIRFIIEDGKRAIAESIGCPIEVTVVDKRNQREVTYSTHEGESFPVPLFFFQDEEGEDDEPGKA